MRSLPRYTVAVALALAAPFTNAADWPGFRGDGGAVSAEANLPAGFTAESGLRYKVALPGRGVSSPVVVGATVYVTCSSGLADDKLHVVAIDRDTGKVKWQRTLAATGATGAHPDSCMAAPTPVADATGVYALFACGDLAAFDPEGNLRWYRSLVGDYPAVSNLVGMAASPVLVGGKIVVPMDSPGEAFIAALDCATGANMWRVTRPKAMNWTTPAVRKTSSGGSEVLFLGQSELTAYDAATGAKRTSVKVSGSIPSPSVLPSGAVLCPVGGVAMLDFADDKGKEVWKSPKLQTGMSSPVAHEGKVYGVTSAGFLTCLDQATGKQLWQERVPGRYSASPVVGDGKIYLLNEAGTLVTVGLGDKPEILAQSETGERGQATPAISGGLVFVRTAKSLFCVGK